MRIGIMLRHYDQQDGGVKVYTRKILPLLFTNGPQHQYVLIYQNPRLVGTYSQYRNVEEVCSGIPGTVSWDQIAVPWIAHRKKLDLIFNPKFTVPYFTRAKTAFVLHGSEWFAIPEHFKKHDQWYFKRAAPFYCRHADAFIAVSAAVKADVVKYVGVDPAKVFAIHNGFDPNVFAPADDVAKRAAARRKYSLPDRFILWAGQIESRKNLTGLFRAFAKIAHRVPHDLVLAGAMRWNSGPQLQVLQDLGIADRVSFPGWIAHDDLATVYSLADLFAFPSLYEGFGIPLLEAMACGCPIVTANTCAPPEVVRGAAVLVDPLDTEQIALGMLKLLFDAPLRARLIAAGIERAKAFGWGKCVTQILEMFDRLDQRQVHAGYELHPHGPNHHAL
jgi:glycosyltransferase involved in cell wall biosynthesis